MKKINTGVFQEIVGADVDIVSTIDHPYTSPPSHIFDAHNYLMEKYGDSILMLNWDVSLPGDRTYRYDLTTDTGLIAKLPSLYLYRPDDFYCNQTLQKISLSTLQRCVDVSLRVVKEKYGLPESRIGSIHMYCDQILRLSQSSYDPTPWRYTKNLLINFYRFVGRNDMASFISNNYGHYWQSDIVTKWIPWCIKNVGGQLSISALMNSGVFLRDPFRVNGKTVGHPALEKSSSLAELIIRGDTIPSLDVFLWSLYVAGVRHYGNDFGFFNRLATHLNDTTIHEYQASSPGKDATKIVTLGKDYGVLLEVKDTGEVVKSQKPYQHSKSSRINSLFAATVLGGDVTIEFLKRYKRGQSGIVIKL